MFSSMHIDSKLTTCNLRQSLHAGLIIGICTSIFDCSYTFSSEIYYPSGYPAIVTGFNITLWLLLCMLFACIAKPLSAAVPIIRNRRAAAFPLFVLLPFAVLYGLLSKLDLDKAVLSNAFDNHLSFLWAVCIVAVPVVFAGRTAKVKTSAASFLPEIIAVISVYIFCSNFARILAVTGLVNPWAASDGETGMAALKAVYAAGVTCILVVYMLFYFKTSSLGRNGKTELALTAVLIAVYLTGFAKSFNSYEELLPQKSGEAVEKKMRSVVLIVLDTVRADRLPMYGHSDIETPCLSGFAEDSLVYDRCIASSPWTLPSHASLFTGLYPAEHGSHNVITEDRWFGNLIPSKPLSEDFTTLAEIFKRHDYTTAGIVSNYLYLQPGFQLDQGFDYYDCKKNAGSLHGLSHKPIIHTASLLFTVMPKLSIHYVVAEDISRKACRLLDRLNGSSFFLFLNYMDAHGPYRPPRKHSSWAFPQLYRIFNAIKNRLGLGIAMSSNDINLLEYDGELKYMDSQLKKVFRQMKKLDIYDSSLIVIVSDHGELFGEHGFYGHRNVSMYSGVLHVPLMVKLPYQRASGRRTDDVPLHGLFAMILKMCGLPLPDDDFERAESGLLAADYYESSVGRHSVVYDGRYKYMWFEKKRTHELYDLARDPLEQTNLADSLPEKSSRMKALLDDWKGTYRPALVEEEEVENVISHDMVNGLKALGYMQ